MMSEPNPLVAHGGQHTAQSTKTTAVPMSSNTINAAPKNAPRASEVQSHHIWLVTGPSGSGKSTVAQKIAQELKLPYIEGDNFHPPANIAKMSAGTPLTDADRWDWLTALREESIRQIQAGNTGVVLTCSALKRKYRDVIRVAPYFNNGVYLHFIFLSAPEEVLISRVTARSAATDHYFGADMVHSQFAILESPTPDEVDVISVDVTLTPDEVMKDALDKINRVMQAQEEEDKARSA